MDDARRITWLKSTLIVFFIAGIFLAGQLWSGVRSYPLAPLLPFLAALPAWADFSLSFALLASLLAALFSRKPGPFILTAVAVTGILFLQDQNRLFPSFFEYWALLVVLLFYYYRDRGHVLGVCRLAIAFVYFWSGAQKLVPSFGGQLAFVFSPLGTIFPLLNNSGFIQWAAIIAPLIEMEIGVGLLFRRTRKWALAEAIAMHAALFFLIGPFRDPSYLSAWSWNLASAVIVFVLFFKADAARAGATAKVAVARAFVLIAFGLLPALNFANLWDSSLSFNVFSGNVAYADIGVDGITAGQFPANARAYIVPVPEADGLLPLDMNAWAESAFHSQPVPAPRIFKAIAHSLCRYADRPSGIVLTVYDKQNVLQAWTGGRNVQRYDCGDL